MSNKNSLKLISRWAISVKVVLYQNLYLVKRNKFVKKEANKCIEIKTEWIEN